MTAKKALKTDPANRRSPAKRLSNDPATCEWVTVMDCNMTCAMGKRMRKRLTDKVSRPPKVGRLDCTVRFHFLSVMALMPFIVNFFEYKGDLK